MRFLERYCEGKILDLGGGQGAYSYELVRKGYEVLLAEKDPECVESARKSGLQAMQTDDDSLRGLEGAFDTVLLLEVLEHVPDYGSFFKLALACTRKKLLMTVPCNDDFEELFKCNLTYGHIAVSDHLHQFTSRDVHTLLASTECRVSMEMGDYLLPDYLFPLVFSRLSRSAIGYLATLPLKVLNRAGLIPKAFPSRMLVAIEKAAK